MKYCKDTTLHHHLVRRYQSEVELLKNIFVEEGGTATSFNDEKALNLDKIEIKRCAQEKSSLNPTMDFAMGISDFGKKGQMLLVELKFRIKHPLNLKKEDIESKIKYSVDNLLLHDTRICKEKIVLFNKKVAPVANSYFQREYYRYKKEPPFIVMSEQEFKTEYF
ncbi:MAG: hypothetical protein LBO74_00440 [Candidatus Symbiothrix sp.]|jgi:hypothetical protein|nr:hypothetical protein [Candidatus Symbiothrix sp.]